MMVLFLNRELLKKGRPIIWTDDAIAHPDEGADGGYCPDLASAARTQVRILTPRPEATPSQEGSSVRIIINGGVLTPGMTLFRHASSSATG
jgi:hypothetical protein